MSLTAKWLPKPIQSLLLLVVWLMLNSTLSLGHIILGSILAVAIPLLCAPLQVPQPKIVRPIKAIGFIAMVVSDIVVANIQVAILVIGPMRRIKPGFVAIPLDLEEILPITILASTCTMTPGTVSAEISEDRKWLYVHVLNMPEDQQDIINHIKQRYEAPIKEIFAC